jgi:hypothetical protein
MTVDRSLALLAILFTVVALPPVWRAIEALWARTSRRRALRRIQKLEVEIARTKLFSETHLGLYRAAFCICLGIIYLIVKLPQEEYEKNPSAWLKIHGSTNFLTSLHLAYHLSFDLALVAVLSWGAIGTFKYAPLFSPTRIRAMEKEIARLKALSNPGSGPVSGSGSVSISN